MANQTQLSVIKQGVEVWNVWCEENRQEEIDLSNTDLSGLDLSAAYLENANLSGAKLREANLSKANLVGASLQGADLSNANFSEAVLYVADLSDAILTKAFLDNANCEQAVFARANLSQCSGSYVRFWMADLTKADLSNSYLPIAYLGDATMDDAVLMGTKLPGAWLGGTSLVNAKLKDAILASANLKDANLAGADLRGSILQGAVLTDVNLAQATLDDSFVYGVSAWNIKGDPKSQLNLIITPYDKPDNLRVDDLQVAQFLYLLLNNQNVRNVIDTVTSKAVLILGRFTEERKAVLDALHAELRRRDYLPILFDFSGPQSRDITETVSTLAHLAKFIIADITDAKSIPQELQAVVPNLPSVPVQPILLASQEEYGMFGHFKRYPWVLPTYFYQDTQEVVSSLSERILAPLEAKAKELTSK